MSHDDAPALLFARQKNIKAGKVAHKCWACEKMIEVGEPKVKLVMMDAAPRKDRVAETSYCHPACVIGYTEEI